jgi:uncharacterized NAD-dependent epimerase/dehydratase family protein
MDNNRDMTQLSNNGSHHSLSGRRLIILTEGHTEPVTGKTATCVVRYRPEQVVALLDSTQVGKTAQELLGVGGSIPIVGKLADAPQANALMLGIAPSGGRIPPPWRAVIFEAIQRGMDVVSGLHEFLSNDPEFVKAAAEKGVQLIDVRKNNERDVAHRKNIREECLRIHTVGQDCSVGKMLVALELTNAMKAQGVKAKFIATGQTGIMVEGDGSPIDCVVSDFVSGAVEKMILAHQHNDVLFIEGQGSLSHPRYSGVTLGLLHGCMPHGMILCYEVGRKNVYGMDYIQLKSLAEMVKVNEMMANLQCRSKVIGIAMNSRKVSAEEAERERERVRQELGLPVCDVIRHGPDELLQAVYEMMPGATVA